MCEASYDDRARGNRAMDGSPWSRWFAQASRPWTSVHGSVARRGIFGGITILIALVATSCGTPSATPPNIILIVTDDQGWTQISYRSDPERADSMSDYIETPHMARMAERGMRFTDGYAPNAMCSPTRHSMLFGQNAGRHIYNKTLDWLPEADSKLTIPKAIKQANPQYRTAHFGKWHVGMEPRDAGFDYSDGLSSNGAGDIQNGRHRDTDGIGDALEAYNTEHGIVPPTFDGRYSKQPVYYPDDDPKGAVSMANRAEAFMRESQAAGRPFFAYIAHYATHMDSVAKSETYEYFKSKPRGKKHDDPAFAAMAKDMDASIGHILDVVDEMGIAGNTYIFLMGDNGGVQVLLQTAVLGDGLEVRETHETNIPWRNLPLRHGKHEYYEGGIRVPFLAIGPGIEAGSVCREPASGLDFLPTFAELAGGLELPENLDGDSLVDALHNNHLDRKREALMFHQGANRTPISAIRKGKYKLIKHWSAGQDCRYCGAKLLELYDLSEDLGEMDDLSDELPEVTASLDGELNAFLNEVGAETEFADRVHPYNRLVRRLGPDAGQTMLRPDYVSPFAQE